MGPIREENLLLYTHYGESSEDMEGDRGRDRVRLFSLVTSFQGGLEGDHVSSIRCTPDIVLSRIFFKIL